MRLKLLKMAVTVLLNFRARSIQPSEALRLNLLCLSRTTIQIPHWHEILVTAHLKTHYGSLITLQGSKRTQILEVLSVEIHTSKQTLPFRLQIFHKYLMTLIRQMA